MGKTGINYIDELSSEERKQAVRNARQFLNSLTQEQRAEQRSRFLKMVERKVKNNQLFLHFPFFSSNSYNNRIGIQNDVKVLTSGFNSLNLLLYYQTGTGS